jgi:hypothetical protein
VVTTTGTADKYEVASQRRQNTYQVGTGDDTACPSMAALKSFRVSVNGFYARLAGKELAKTLSILRMKRNQSSTTCRQRSEKNNAAGFSREANCFQNQN